MGRGRMTTALMFNISPKRKSATRYEEDAPIMRSGSRPSTPMEPSSIYCVPEKPNAIPRRVRGRRAPN